MGPLHEQPVLLSFEPPLQPLFHHCRPGVQVFSFVCSSLPFTASKCPQGTPQRSPHSYLLHATVDQGAVAHLGGPVHHNAFSELRVLILTHVMRTIQGIEDP